MSEVEELIYKARCLRQEVLPDNQIVLTEGGDDSPVMLKLREARALLDKACGLSQCGEAYLERALINLFLGDFPQMKHDAMRSMSCKGIAEEHRALLEWMINQGTT